MQATLRPVHASGVVTGSGEPTAAKPSQPVSAPTAAATTPATAVHPTVRTSARPRRPPSPHRSGTACRRTATKTSACETLETRNDPETPGAAPEVALET